MHKYRDIESIINILASVKTLDDKDFTRYKELILTMCNMQRNTWRRTANNWSCKS